MSEVTMIKVTVMYPKTKGAGFDMEYYKTKHFAIVDRTMKPDRWEIATGVDGPYEAMASMYWASMEAMQAGMSAIAEARADIPNYTTIKSVVQIAEVVETS
jgi:uncharacterized protein (TIGR02118 family)